LRTLTWEKKQSMFNKGFGIEQAVAETESVRRQLRVRDKQLEEVNADANSMQVNYECEF